jgi:acyl-CoA synthetase (AMP-forming)/AMP-acid ligase II
MLQMLIEHPALPAHDLSSLRMVTFGSSPASPALIRSVSEKLGCDLLNCYAMTETTWGGISFLGPADIRRGLCEAPHLLESVGRVSGLFEISIRDESGAEQPTGTPGEIWLRSEANMLGYLDNPAETADALRDGWLRTNDIGRLDQDGFLYLLDRRNFVIISGGINIYPVVVEAVLAEHPDVAESCVVGVPHHVWGEAVVAMVVPKPGRVIVEEELRLHCRERLNRVQVPKRFVIVDEPLPRTVTGKLRKKEVRQRVLPLVEE